MGHFTSLVIWEGFQGEAVAELNPTAVRPASGSLNSPTLQSTSHTFGNCFGDTEVSDGGKAVKSPLSSASLQRQGREVNCDAPKSIF